MSMFSDKILKGINKQFDDNTTFKTVEDVCVNIYLADAVFRACFILDEDKDLLTFVATDSEGREKLKVINKNFIQSVEIYYLDDEMTEKMNEAAEYLMGKHDYRSFCRNPKSRKSTVRIVDEIRIRKKGSYLTLTFHGTGFLQQMVRIMVGTLLLVGEGKLMPEEVKTILEECDRSKAGPAAPPQGLCLLKVDYM